ncbi:MAG TPA: aminotransferase class I/II-fold pyridoxal phosphate-dependent enzyme [Candidatus Woesebacteria bacterium]|nr:aminotransferase class I/II-fold pyridoxal phosphate-dependent enzyme [Candidatus Woesebacteria bacterium]HPK08593.1 aminotransferase class I/II-fold pyridoxal phosphate-dependent enzyme [Candidatus Woesebacteria bacterium]HPR14023.1 aminotransferase class I/II-fold pyridoxal phosphate-dependent enzyme [Candidatus Woesebacteria bacterium]
MPRQDFFKILQKEVARIDAASVTKRKEHLIAGFTQEASPKAIIDGKPYRIFNSNDYLGLRHHRKLKKAEHQMTELCGTGPGAVRFISGSFQVHRDLEKALANFHGRDDAMVFSSAFATNLAVLFSLIKGQSKDSVLQSEALVISDELNHRSIIDGIRVANLPSNQKAIFKHLDSQSLEEILQKNVKKFKRVLVVTDGAFSMLGEYQDLKKLRRVINHYDKLYPEGVLLVVDDCHGVAAFGKTGRGTEEVSGAKADVLIGTLGKGLGADGGYVVAKQVVIDYLRESAATYIYSNPISPGTAAAALAAVQLLDSSTGAKLLEKLADNLVFIKKELSALGFQFAAESIHPIQAILIGDTAKTKALTEKMFERGFIVTNINYPVVPKGKDEIRVQISASHNKTDLKAFLQNIKEVGEELAII